MNEEIQNQRYPADPVQDDSDVWFVSTPGGELGPFPVKRIRGFVSAGLLPPEDTVRHAQSGEQLPAGDLLARLDRPPSPPARDGASFGPARVHFQSF